MNIDSYVVRGSNGSVDVDASVAKFQSDLASHVATGEAREALIATAVNAVFEDNKGKRITMPALQTFTVAKLGTSPEDHSSTSEQVAQYVRSNAGEGKLFSIVKGKNGGCARSADITPKQ